MKKLWCGLVLLYSMGCNHADEIKQDDAHEAAAFDEKIESLTTAVHQNPDSAGGRLALVFLLDSAGKYIDASVQMDSLILKDSLNAGLWFAKAQLAENNGDTATAVVAYRKSLLIYPAPDNVLAFGNLLAEMADKECLEIAAYIKRLKMGRGYDAHADFITGVFYARSHNSAKATAALDACIANNYTYMEAYIEKGLLPFDAGDYRSALAVFVMASKVNNLYADAYYYQARCYEMLDRKSVV